MQLGTLQGLLLCAVFEKDSRSENLGYNPDVERVDRGGSTRGAIEVPKGKTSRGLSILQKLGETSGVEDVSAAKLGAWTIAKVAHADHTRVSLGELALWGALRLHTR